MGTENALEAARRHPHILAWSRIARSQLLVAIAAGLLCSATLLLTAGSPLNQAGTLDPFIYAGYAHDYAGLLERFGHTYYSTRIAYIFPEKWLVSLLGTEGGYYALRFLALASATAAVFAIALRYYGYAPAILAAVWLSFTPWLPRSLLWTHYDGVAVVYVLVGIAFLLVPTERRLIGHGGAGALFALAVNCNPFLLAVCGPLSPGWLLANWSSGRAWMARASLAVITGFIVTYLILSLVLYLRYPENGFLLLSTIRDVIAIAPEEHTWFKPFSWLWYRQDFTFLITLTLFMSALVLFPPRRTDKIPMDRLKFTLFALPYFPSIVALALAAHFGFHHFWLSFLYYTVYFVPGCVLAVVMIGGEAERCGGPLWGTTAVSCGIGIIVLSWLDWPVLPDTSFGWLLWPALGAITVAAALASRRTPVASVVLVCSATVLMLSLSEVKDRYENPLTHSWFAYARYDVRNHRRTSALEWDLYRGGVFLEDLVNANLRPDQRVGFWYSKTPGGLLDSVQSMYLWDYSRAFSADEPGMPVIDADFRRRIAGRRFLVLLGRTEDDIATGLAALQEARLPFHEMQRTAFKGRIFGYFAVLIKLLPQHRELGPLLFGIPLTVLQSANGGRVMPIADQLRLESAPPQWSYSATAPLRADHELTEGTAVVRVRLQVTNGQIGLAISSASNYSDVIREVWVDAAPELQEIDLDLPDLLAAGLLIIRNGSPRGPSSAVLQSIDVFRAN